MNFDFARLVSLPEIIWRYGVLASIITISFFGAWGLGFTSFPGSPVGTLIIEVTGIQESLVCSNLKSDIEVNRKDLYDIDREIEMADGDVTERVLERQSELKNTLRDNDAKFDKLGCITVLA